MARIYDFSVLTTFLLLTYSSIHAQSPQFEKIFGPQGYNNKGYSVKQSTTGFIYFLGESDTTGNFDLALTKLKPNGDIIWTKTYGTADIESAVNVVFTRDGQLLLSGVSLRQADQKHLAYFVKVDTNGTQLWEQAIEDPAYNIHIHYAETDHDSGFIACGYITEPSHLANDMYVMKLDSAGNLVWDRQYDVALDNDYAQKIKKTNDGGYILVGDTKNGLLYDVYMAKLLPGGTVDWDLTFGDEYSNGSQDIWYNATDNCYYMSGESSTVLSVNFDVYLAKVTADGQLVWIKWAGATGTDAGFSIKPSTDGKFLITGYSNSYNSSAPVNVFLCKIDTNGIAAGVKYFHQPNVSIGYEIIPSYDGNYLLSGFTGTNFYLIYTADSGYTEPFTNGFGLQETHTSPFIVYPNPTHGHVSISLAGNEGLTRWQLRSADGKTLQNGQTGQSQFSIPVQQQPAGIYLLQLTVEDKTYTHRLVVK